MEDFKQVVQNYIKVDAKIKELAKELKELKAKKMVYGNEIQTEILGNSEHTDTPVVKFGENKFEVKKVKISSKKFNKHLVRDIINEKVPDSELKNELLDDFFGKSNDFVEEYKLKATIKHV